MKPLAASPGRAEKQLPMPPGLARLLLSKSRRGGGGRSRRAPAMSPMFVSRGRGSGGRGALVAQGDLHWPGADAEGEEGGGSGEQVGCTGEGQGTSAAFLCGGLFDLDRRRRPKAPSPEVVERSATRRGCLAVGTWPSPPRRSSRIRGESTPRRTMRWRPLREESSDCWRLGINGGNDEKEEDEEEEEAELVSSLFCNMAPIHKSRLGKAPIVIDSDDSDDIDVDPSDDDDEECNGGKIDDIVLGIHRKMVKRQKACATKEPSFRRFSARYFSEVVNSLFAYQKSIVEKYEFDSLLLFESNFVPVKTSEIILKDKIIPITKESVHDVLGVPLGGIEFGKDYETGRQSLSMPPVKFFGDQLIQKKELSEHQIITSFLIVALACFLCPNSSRIPSIKYMNISEDVLYLDYVDFGSRNVDQGCPRISVWKHDMISSFSKLDEVDDFNYGLRPIKNFHSTCYFKPEPAHSRSNSILANLDSAVGTLVPDLLKDRISEMFSEYCCSHHIVDTDSLEELLVSIISLLAESSKSAHLQHQTEHHAPIITEDGPSNSQPASPKGKQCHNPVLNSGQHFVTPDVSYLRNRNNFLNEGSSVTALSLVKNVANKFRLRFANFNNRSSILGEDMPSFKLLDSDDDVSDFDEKNELCGDATPSSSQHCISFHSVEDTPEYMIPGNQNLGSNKRSNSQNVNKRIFQDLTNSPDVQLLGESKFNDRCKKLCTNTDDFYNACNNLCKSNQDLSSSGGKLPLHGPRRVVIPARVASDPFVTNRLRFSITDEERRYYIAICRLAESSKWQSYYAIDIDNVKAKFYSFGNSLKKGGSLSHYEQLIGDLSILALEKVDKSFTGAGKARKLNLCDMLFFPIYYNEHWFLFIVDIKDRMLVILDSLHHEGHDYFEPILSLLINNLQTVWDKFVDAPLNFHGFKIVFPPVPRQEYNCDSGVYVMKFVELWSPRIVLSNVFGNENINNIRVQYANQIFFHPKNRMLQTEIEDVVLIWFDAVSFITSQIFFFSFFPVVAISFLYLYFQLIYFVGQISSYPSTYFSLRRKNRYVFFGNARKPPI
uniref:Ubiquitin-like protease family profile domain-containing protein n=1 Tax=Oryza punctata TaxID=4537 RepID=A0A0E0JZU9_ORYPU